MIKDILVILDGVGERAGPFAIDLARTLDATVTGVCVLPEAPFQTFAFAEVSYDMIVSAREEANRAAEAIAGRFADAARAANVATECSSICALPAIETQKVEREVRLSDLIVIEQPDPDRHRPADAHLETALLRSGRPTLVVPYIHRTPPRFNHITVAWDGSSAAARALGDALPFLRRADRVEIITVVRDHDEEDPDLAPKLRRHLSRHEIDPEFRRVGSEIAIPDTILSHVADEGSDMLVMGAYGHSRLREAILGGASQGILHSMTCPVLMSH